MQCVKNAVVESYPPNVKSGFDELYPHCFIGKKEVPATCGIVHGGATGHEGRTIAAWKVDFKNEKIVPRPSDGLRCAFLDTDNF